MHIVDTEFNGGYAGVIATSYNQFTPYVTATFKNFSIQVALGFQEVTGNFIIREVHDVKQSTGELTKEIISENRSEDSIDIITKSSKEVGTIADVKFSEQVGITDRELFKYLATQELGTIATRTNIIKALEDQGFLLKFNGEYKLDDRARIMMNVFEASGFNPLSFNNQLKEKRAIVEQDMETYTQEKQWLYNELFSLVQNLKNRLYQGLAISKFKEENRPLEQIQELHSLAIEKPEVEIV